MKLSSLLLLFWLLASAVGAETIRLDNHDDDIVFNARGEDIIISGQHGNVVIQGSAHRVTVSGAGHDVTIHEAADMVIDGDHLDITVERVGAIMLGGHHNDVVVTACRPVVTYTGDNNDLVSTMGVEPAPGVTTQVVSEEVVSSSKKLTLDGTSIVQTVDGDGQDVILNGSSNRLILTGRPKSVTINGALNDVTVEQTAKIAITGANNKVRYRSGQPTIDNVGYGNKISGP